MARLMAYRLVASTGAATMKPEIRLTSTQNWSKASQVAPARQRHDQSMGQAEQGVAGQVTKAQHQPAQGLVGFHRKDGGQQSAGTGVPARRRCG